MTIDLSERFRSFSKREREICAMLMKGLTNKQIARNAGISPRTVEDHRSAILRKANASNMIHLVHIAFGEPEVMA